MVQPMFSACSTLAAKSWTRTRSITVIAVVAMILLVVYVPFPYVEKNGDGSIIFHVASTLRLGLGNLKRRPTHDYVRPQVAPLVTTPEPIQTTLSLRKVALLPYDTAYCPDKKAWTAQCNTTCVGGKGEVPRLVHFIYIGKSMALVHWLAVRSAMRYVQGATVIIHYKGVQETCWAKRIKAMPGVVFSELKDNELASSVNGVKVVHLAHKADFLRTQLLWNYGGVYMDFDAILTKSFDPLMTYEAVVSRDMDGYMGNGLLVSRRRSCFICTFATRSCKAFDGSWAAHSVLLMIKVAEEVMKHNPSLKVLNANEGFFPFGPANEMNKQLYAGDLSTMKDFSLTTVYALHLFNKSSRGRIMRMTYDWIMNNRSPVAALSRSLLPKGFNSHSMNDKLCASIPDS